MKWCDHCCRFSQTRVENIIHESSGKYCSSCTMCGKILLDLGRNPRRIKKRRKSNVKIVKKELAIVSIDMEMEWCSHCCRLCPTRLETIDGDISVNSCSVCVLCGKVLLDLNASLHTIFSNKKINKSSRRKKRRRNIKNDAQALQEESDASQTSDNFEAV
ncbi:hypothetical protein GLYMA_14G045700v4 [Glycine max]|nr:hypothetical protein GLYMA_14G045700v4 [Glycine max]|eukprot:XP_014622072.1 uncharacterized protein LOC106795727 [Glycine max]